MADKQVASSVFRLTYSSLDEPVAVTVLGRVIGRWVPVGSPVMQPRTPEVGLTAPSPSVESGVVRTTESAPEPLTGNGSVAGLSPGERAYIADPLLNDAERFAAVVSPSVFVKPPEIRPYSKSRQAKRNPV